MVSIECIFIDLGSRNTKGAWEPVGIKFSSFPSTLLYISNNKVPISDYQFSDSDSDMDMNEDFDQQERLENSLKTTSIQALDRDKEARHEACKELFDKDGNKVKEFEVDAGLFKSALAEYCDAF